MKPSPKVPKVKPAKMKPESKELSFEERNKKMLDGFIKNLNANALKNIDK